MWELTYVGAVLSFVLRQVLHVLPRLTFHEPSTFKIKYRGTSLIRKRTPLGPYSWTLPRFLGESWRGGRFLMSEVPLYSSCQAVDKTVQLPTEHRGGNAASLSHTHTLSLSHTHPPSPPKPADLSPSRRPGPLSSEFGTCKTVTARFWP